MMKKFLIIVFLFCAYISSAQVKFVQLQKCLDPITKLPEDSCCVITGTDGALKYLHHSDCMLLYGGTVSVNTVDSVLEQNGIEIDNVCLVVKKCETLTYFTQPNDSTYRYHDEQGNTYDIEIPQPENPPPATTIEVVDSIFLVDGVELDGFCNAVKKCETITEIQNNSNNGSYHYMNERGQDYEIRYKFDKELIGQNGFLYLVDHNGNKSDSVNLCDPGCPQLQVTAEDDSYDAETCTSPLEFDVSINDSPCNMGTSVYSWTGAAEGGYVIMDADGHGHYYFTDCDASKPHNFLYQICCSDGTCDNALVTINLPDCPGSAIANTDIYTGKQGYTSVFSVGTNDVNCGVGQTTTWKINQLPLHGSITITESNGIGSYSPVPSFTGTDSCIIGLYCNNVLCDTSWLKFKININNLKDDYYILLNNKTKSGLNATVNDGTCSVGTTSWEWKTSWIPANSITGSGNPDNFSITSQNGFCGQSYREYYQKCDGVVNDSAIVYVYHVCGQAFPDEFETSDSNFVGDVTGNDIRCSNTGISTWHLLDNPTSSGTGLNIALYDCDGVGCPEVTSVANQKIVAWDTLTGKYTIDFQDTWTGELCFTYFLKCKLPDGSNFRDTACVKIIRVKEATAYINITMPDTTTPEFKIKLGAWCTLHGGGKTCLVNGDKVHVRIPTAQGTLDVDWIIGQDIKTGGGYTNDASNRYANWMLGSLIGNTVLDAANLCNSNMILTFRKDSFARKSNNWGDGTITPQKIGQDLLMYFNVESGSCNEGLTLAVDTIYKLYEVCGYYLSGGNNPVCSGAASGNVFYCVNGNKNRLSPWGGSLSVTNTTPSGAFISIDNSCDSVTWATAPYCNTGYFRGCLHTTTGTKHYRANTNIGYYFPNITAYGMSFVRNAYFTGTLSGLSENHFWYPFLNYDERNIKTMRCKMASLENDKFFSCMSNNQDEWWVGNTPNDLAHTGSNRTMLLQNTNANNTGVNIDYTFPEEGRYWMYSRGWKTGCNYPYVDEIHYINIFSY